MTRNDADWLTDDQTWSRLGDMPFHGFSVASGPAGKVTASVGLWQNGEYIPVMPAEPPEAAIRAMLDAEDAHRNDGRVERMRAIWGAGRAALAGEGWGG